MPTVTPRLPKSKITVTLSPDLVRQLDALLKAPQSGSRSLLVEEALHQWLHDQALKDLDRRTEEYYRALSKTERDEDRRWSQIAARSAKRLWNK